MRSTYTFQLVLVITELHNSQEPCHNGYLQKLWKWSGTSIRSAENADKPQLNLQHGHLLFRRSNGEVAILNFITQTGSNILSTTILIFRQQILPFLIICAYSQAIWRSNDILVFLKLGPPWIRRRMNMKIHNSYCYTYSLTFVIKRPTVWRGYHHVFFTNVQSFSSYHQFKPKLATLTRNGSFALPANE